MKLIVELDREIDGRWIAEVPELNVLLYGDSNQDAIRWAKSAAMEERSQFRNRKLALARLGKKIDTLNAGRRDSARAEQWRAHYGVERGESGAGF
ncbi:MAG: hypothetical protein HYX27_14920 [Acidobacteria bacterium]|nr:hypothetical protein [Acidobacteriota bacterium]